MFEEATLTIQEMSSQMPVSTMWDSIQQLYHIWSIPSSTFIVEWSNLFQLGLLKSTLIFKVRVLGEVGVQRKLVKNNYIMADLRLRQ